MWTDRGSFTRREKKRQGDDPGEEVVVTVIVVDICDSVEKGLKLEDFNSFYHETVPFVLSNGGQLEKFTGDGFIAFWYPDDEDSAITACKMILQQSPFSCRIGIATSKAEVGYAVAGDRSDIAVVGEAIVVASYLRRIARSGEVIRYDRRSGLQIDIKGKRYGFERET